MMTNAKCRGCISKAAPRCAFGRWLSDRHDRFADVNPCSACNAREVIRATRSLCPTKPSCRKPARFFRYGYWRRRVWRFITPLLRGINENYGESARAKAAPCYPRSFAKPERGPGEATVWIGQRREHKLLPPERMRPHCSTAQARVLRLHAHHQHQSNALQTPNLAGGH